MNRVFLSRGCKYVCAFMCICVCTVAGENLMRFICARDLGETKFTKAVCSNILELEQKVWLKLILNIYARKLIKG